MSDRRTITPQVNDQIVIFPEDLDKNLINIPQLYRSKIFPRVTTLSNLLELLLFRTTVSVWY